MAVKTMREILSGEPGELKAGEMTLRDWFAGQALAAIAPETRVDLHQQNTAEIAYEIADAMMRERVKKE